MSIQLTKARLSDSSLIEAMLNPYLRELSSYREVSVGAIDSAV